MASYHYLLQHKNNRVESPAKVFAKLKSKVQREAMCAQDPLCNVRENHGADINSPRRSEESCRMTSDIKENQRFGPYRHEVQPLTLSPISTPQKTFSYSFSDIRPVDETAVTEMEHVFMSRKERTPKKRVFLESTAVCHPTFLVKGEQIYTATHQIRDLDASNMSSRAEKDSRRGVFEGGPAPLDELMSPNKVFSPVNTRFRKRKWEQQEFGKVSCSLKEVGNEVGGFSPEQSEMDQVTPEPMFPPSRVASWKRCSYFTERLPLMSPSKMFAYMKERESRREHQEVVSSKNELFSHGNNFHQVIDSPLSTPQDIAEIEDAASRSVLENKVPVSCSKEESADSSSDPSEDTQIPAVLPQPVLLEDPLVLSSPQISIPKKKQAVFKHIKCPQRTQFPNESIIYLRNWFLRKNQQGLFVDGIHREDNIPWSSNIISERLSNSVLKTVSGRIYILVGKMNLGVDSDFPNWLLKKFVNGFPTNWKSLYETFLSESRKNSERSRKGKADTDKTKSEASSKPSVKRHRQKTFKTPDSCPPAFASAKISRSGRMIKPPLEYWKGGRVILDADMNVTIHECYDTSICDPVITTTVSARKAQKPANVFLPCMDGQKQTESACKEVAPVPVRKVKPPCHKPKHANVSHEEKPSHQLKSSVETVSSPEEWPGRTTRSRNKCLAMERISYVDTVPKKLKEPTKASVQRSKKQTHDNRRPLETACKQTVTASPESPTVNDKTIQQTSPDDVFSAKREKQGKALHRTRGRKGRNKSKARRVSLSSPSSEVSPDSREESRKRTRPQKTKYSNSAKKEAKLKPSKCAKISPPTKPLPKTRKKHKGSVVDQPEQDEDTWTEAELIKLQEAVSCYPKHMLGYWTKVARMVGTRSAEQCHSRHTSQGTSQTPAKRTRKSTKEKVEAPKEPDTDHPIISARAGTLKRKQQVRQFLEAMPKENVEDIFTSAEMKQRRFEIPSMCLSEDNEFKMSHLEPLTPMSKVYPEAKTPQCLHITPGMMGCQDSDGNDKYVYQLQKRMKKKQFNVCKQAPPPKSFTQTPSVKGTMRRCGNTENDTFVVWEMFPGNDAALSESEEEEDYYFSDTS